MKTVWWALAIVLAMCAPSFSQTQPSNVTGRWRAEGIGRPFPWEVVLRADGPMLVGAVNSCASNLGGALEIFDGRIDERTVAFKCRSGDRYRVVTLSGTLNGDEIVFAWQLQVFPGGTNPFANSDGLFGVSAPSRFTVRRVPDTADALSDLIDRVPGMEFSAAVNLQPKDVKVEGTIFVPSAVTRVRVVLVTFEFGLGYNLIRSPQWPKLLASVEGAGLSVRFSSIGPGVQKGLAAANAEGAGTDALIAVLQRLSQETGHQELAEAPLVFWGHSGAGGVASTFASRLPERTLAFVRYHSGPNPGGDLRVVSRIPALILEGGKDMPDFNVAAELLWRSGRLAAAPWTFAVEPDATHGNAEDLKNANRLLIPWIAAVVRLRLPPNGGSLRAVSDASAWMGDSWNLEVAPYDRFSGSRTESSWLPDETSARAWQAVLTSGAVK